MKTQVLQTKTPPVKVAFFLLIILVPFTSVLSDTKNHNWFLSINSGIKLISPDTIYTDSTTNQIGDTIAIIAEGEDTTYVLSDYSEQTGISDRLISFEDIVIGLTNTQIAVKEEIYGVNLEGFFEKYNNTVSQQDKYSNLSLENPYELAISFSPKVLRYPSGTSSKFQHPFGSPLSDELRNTYNSIAEAADQKTGNMNGGCGYDLEEIIRYFDKTNEAMGGYTLNSILNDIIPDEKLTPATSTWINSDDIPEFEKIYVKWKEQPTYNNAAYTHIWDKPLYINDFIKMVKAIEEAKGYTIDVITAVNILSEPAEEVTHLIDYLTSATENNIYSVHLKGVELGNECYFSIYGRMLGFKTFDCNTAFDHYWAYINGVDDYNSGNSFFTTTGDFPLSDVLQGGMLSGAGGHNYVAALRSNPAYHDIQIGIPVENPPQEVGGPFIAGSEDELYDEPLTDPCDSTWNSEVVTRYNDKISGKFIINAVIPHLYFTAQNSGNPEENTNWGEIPVGGYTTLTGVDIPNCLDQNTATSIHEDFNTPVYSFATYDARLQCAFDGILDPEIEGSFLNFVKHRQKESMLELATELSLDAHGSIYKECWITEWNIKNNTHDGNDPDEHQKYIRKEVYHNTFVHAYLTQEEFLTFTKLNFQTGFMDNFLTLTTAQNFMDGSPTNFIRNSNDKDLSALGLIEDCISGFHPYLPRALYYSHRLSNQIHLNDLDYLKSIKTIYGSNINQPPTMFIESNPTSLTEVLVYGYFTNAKKNPQTYIIKPGTLTGNSFAGLHGEIHCITASQPYGSEGAEGIYDINTSYTDCTADGYDNWFDINGELPSYVDFTSCPVGAPANAMCVTVPAYSVGYFKFSFDKTLREGMEVNHFYIYPNPSNEYFKIELENNLPLDSKTFLVEIFSSLGSLVSKNEAEIDQKIDISYLPVGVYFIQIHNGNQIESETFVKMK